MQNNISKKEIIMYTVAITLTLALSFLFIPLLLIAAAIYIFNDISGGNDNFSEGLDEYTKLGKEESEDI